MYGYSYISNQNIEKQHCFKAQQQFVRLPHTTYLLAAILYCCELGVFTSASPVRADVGHAKLKSQASLHSWNVILNLSIVIACVHFVKRGQIHCLHNI